MGKISNSLYISPGELLIRHPSWAIDDRLDLLETLLPKGSTHISTSLVGALWDIDAHYSLVFEHPLFEDGSEIELVFSNEIWRSKEDVVNQGKFLTGIKYYNKQGLRMFNYEDVSK